MTCDRNVNGSFRQHPRFEEFDVSVLVPRDFPVDGRRRNVDLGLPSTEHLQRLILDHGAVHAIKLRTGFDDLKKKLKENLNQVKSKRWRSNNLIKLQEILKNYVN